MEDEVFLKYYEILRKIFEKDEYTNEFVLGINNKKGSIKQILEEIWQDGYERCNDDLQGIPPEF